MSYIMENSEINISFKNDNLVYITEANLNKIIKNYENKNENNKEYLYKWQILHFLPFWYLKFLNKYTNIQIY